MDLLGLLWNVSAAMAALSIVVMTGVIGARVLRDRSAVLREADRTAISRLFMRLMDGRNDALNALEAHRRHPQLLAEALLRMFDAVRGGARDELLSRLSAFGLPELLIGELDRAGRAGRFAAIEALGLFPGKPTEVALRAAMRRERGELRLAAVRALMTVGADIQLADLIAGMESGREPWSRPTADLFRLLAERQGADCRAALSDKANPPAARAILAEALGAAGDYAALAALRDAADDPDAAVREAALDALGRLMHPSIENTVAAGLADPAWRVRAAAARAVRTAGLARLQPGLVERLADPVWRVRFEAAEALAGLGASGLEALRDAVRHGADEAARAASLTLAEKGLA